MDDDPLAPARGALASGQSREALRLAWAATMPAVLRQDDDSLRRSAEFAEELAGVSTGDIRDEARRNAAYWLACIEEPRDQQSTAWSFRKWFQRGPRDERMPCPECAESIAVGAKVCRFCGHRLDAPE